MVHLVKFYKKIVEWRRNSMFSDKPELGLRELFREMTELRGDYFFYEELKLLRNDLDISSGELKRESDDSGNVEPPTATVAFLTDKLEVMFAVAPELSLLRFSKSRNIEAFLCFLLELLYHKTNPADIRVVILEKEVRCLLTVLGDISWRFLDYDDGQPQFQKLLAEFESAANRAGRLVHSLLFSTSGSFERMDEELAAVSKRTVDLLRATLRLSAKTSAPNYTAPRTCVMDSLVVIACLLDDLQDLLKREDNSIDDVKNEIKLLHDGLLLLRSSINDVRSSSAAIEEVHLSLMRTGDIALQAQYLVSAFLVKDAPLTYVTTRLANLNYQIQYMRFSTSLTSLNEQIQRVIITSPNNLGGSKVTTHFSAQLPLQDGRENDIIVGLEEEERDILDQLVGGGTQSLQVISILGMAGLGKTTLAKKLYNHPSVNYTFDRLSWCVISQTYETRRIMANILIHINSELDKDEILNMEGEALLECIYKTLKGRRYLVVMDDIWDSNVWYELQRCFPEDNNGSRILLTSRIKDVAPPNSMIHDLPFLSDEQCWELLEKKVFGAKTCPPKLQQVGKKIAEKCRGLPLTAVVIAGILSIMGEEESEWEEVTTSLGDYIDGGENSAMQILELSYNRLPDILKSCFHYLGIYKEDEEIFVEKLYRFWIAEGFIVGENGKSRESVAREYLMELINRNLVMVSTRKSDGRGVKTCVLHDLLRELCLKKCEEDGSHHTFPSIKNKKLVHSRGDLRDLVNNEALFISRHDRSFYGSIEESPFYVGDKILLRVLHFKTSYGAPLAGLEYLVNLRYLVNRQVPTCLDKLQNLEYLTVLSNETTHIPRAIERLNKLRYFEAWKANYGDDWDVNSKCNNLEHLSRITIRKLEDEELLKRSPQLWKLKCRYELVPRRLDKREHPRFDFSFFTQLHSLSLHFFIDGRCNYDQLGFPSNITKLTLDRCRLPWEKISVVGRLENLQVLKLRNRAFEGEVWETNDGEFQSLRFLKLDVASLCEWNVASYQHFPNLHRLIFKDCHWLLEIPDEVGEIPSLELIEVIGRCPNSLGKSAERIKEEQVDVGNEHLRVIVNTY